MGTFLSILGFIFLLIILKFVYDTYLTNNTERRWHEHIKHNKEDVEYFEKKFPQQIDAKPTLKHKGVYLYKDIHELPDGSDGVNVYGLFFTHEDAFFFSTTRDYTTPTIIEKLQTLFTPESFAYREAVTTYIYVVKINFVKMKFKNVLDQGDLNCSCSLEDKNMIVTIIKEFNLNGQIESIPFLTKCKFSFYPINT